MNLIYHISKIFTISLNEAKEARALEYALYA